MTTARKPSGGSANPPGRLLRVGSVVGVPIFVTPSWLLVAAFITVTYSDLLHNQVRGASIAGAYVLALTYALALAASILLHEIGHTVVCRALGLPVRRIIVFLLGGLSEIVGEPQRPRDEFAIAAAGPAMSFLLAGGCWTAGLWLADNSAAGAVVDLLAWSNLIIAIFNVLPGLPLDGGRLVQALFWTIRSSRITGIRVAAWSGRVLAVAVAMVVFLSTSLLSRGSDVGLGSIGATAAGFAVAAFMWFGAGQTLRQAEIVHRARTLNLNSLIRPAVYLPPQVPVAEAVRITHLNGARAIVIVDANQLSRGIVSEPAVTALDPAKRPWTTLAEVAHDVDPAATLPDSLTGEALLEAVSNHPAPAYLVVGGDGITRGVLTAADLSQALLDQRDGQRPGYHGAAISPVGGPTPVTRS